MLTKRQKQVLDYIKRYISKNDYAPSLEEIKRHLKLTSVSTAHYHVQALQNIGYLRKEDNQPRALDVFSEQKLVQIPILGTIAAGQPIEAIEYKENIAVSQTRLKGNQYHFALRVNGESMDEENINDGDIVIIKSQPTADNGQKVVALINNYEVTLKKIYKEKTRVRLEPANPKFKPIFVPYKNLEVQGVVVDIIKGSHRSTVHLDAETNNNPNTIEKLSSYSSRHTSSREITRSMKKLPLNEIIYGDAIEIMKSFPESSIDLTVTSPPYDELRNYNGYIFDFENIAKGLFRVTKKGGVVIWVVSDKIKKGNRTLTSFRHALFFQKVGFNVHDVMIYRKKNTPFMRSNAYTNCYEFMFVFTKGTPKTFNPLQVKTVRQGQEMMPFGKGPDAENKKILKELKPKKTMTNIWAYAVGLHGSTSDRIAFKHPAVFPEKLAEDHVLSWTNKKDVVFDPMCGSGTTCKMAALNGRHYIGCDISKEYAELTKKRLKRFHL